MSFESELHDERRGFAAEPPGAAASALIAFGGVRGGMGIPPYEFFRVTNGLDTRRIFARDLRQTWYLAGIEGLGTTVASSADALRAVVGGPGTRVVTTGNSAGGFGAIVFGALLGATEVHAFSPQTVLSRRQRATWLDLRWSREMRAVRRLQDVPPDLLDLRRFLERPGPLPAIHLYYCGRHRLDRLHAERIADVPAVHVHPYDEGGHRLVGVLRDAGDLHRILAGALSGGD